MYRLCFKIIRKYHKSLQLHCDTLCLHENHKYKITEN